VQEHDLAFQLETGGRVSASVDEFFEENKAHEDHTRKSLRAGAVSVAARALNALVQIGSVLFLARLLSPEDYGLVSMVTAITGFAPFLVDLGTRDAIVQRARISKGEVSTLFWITFGIGVTFAIIAASCGPLIARFYGEPRLTMIVLVSSLTFIACSLSVQHYALMRRVLMFHELAVIEITANVLSASTAITMAFYGAGYWALVTRPILSLFLVAVGVWLKCAWWPGRPEITQGVKESLRFGINITGFTLTDFGSRSSDRIGVGYRNGPAALGQYQNAMFVYDNLLDVLVFPLHGVAVSSLSKLRDDGKQLRRAWAQAVTTVAFYAMPAFGLLAVTSRDVIVLVLGKKWASAGLLLSVLAFRGIPHCVERTLGWLHVTAGRTDRWARWGVFAACVQFCALLCGLPYGPTGVAVGYATAMFALFVPALAYAGRPLGIGANDVIGAVWRQFLGAITAAAIGFLLRFTVLGEMGPVARTAVLAAAYLAVYVAIVIGVLRVLSPIRAMRALVKGELASRLAYVSN
jgi:PST family polysaccharide transporter